MDNFNINNLAFQREVAKNIIAEAESTIAKINKSYLKLAEEYSELEKQFKVLSGVEEVFSHAQKFEKLNNEIIKYLAVIDRLQKLIERNKERILYLDFEIKHNNISSIEVSAKQISKIISESSVSVTDENLGLNLNRNSKLFLDSNFLNIKDDMINLSDPENIKNILKFQEKSLFLFFSKYPTCIAELPVEILLNTKFKIRILQFIANTAYEMAKSKSIFEINEYFGRILKVEVGMKLSFKSYVQEVDNLFTIKIKKYLMENHPKFKNTIDSKINCMSNSALLPANVSYNSDIELLSILFDNLAE